MTVTTDDPVLGPERRLSAPSMTVAVVLPPPVEMYWLADHPVVPLYVSWVNPFCTDPVVLTVAPFGITRRTAKLVPAPDRRFTLAVVVAAAAGATEVSGFRK